MLKSITKKVLKEVIETESEIVVCDVCGKELEYKKLIGNDMVAYYYHIVTGHHDWGNDSCDSVQSKDACCDECLSKLTQEWLKDQDVIDSHTAYFEVQKERHFLKEKANEDLQGNN